MLKKYLIAVVLYPALMLSACAQDSVNSTDTQFLVVGKTANYRQDQSGAQQMINYHFFAEIFVKEGEMAAPGVC